MLEVGRLRALLAMSEHGGPAGAARALGRPAGEVTGQLSDWERELGLPLVDGDRLTPAGRRLAEHAGSLLGQLESAESDAAAIAGRVAGTLRLGVGADAGRVLLPDTLAALRTTDLSLQVRQLATERVDALDSTLDAVVVGEYGAAVPHRGDPAVERRELFTEPLLLAVPSRHRATGASVRLAELSGEAWIGGAGDALVALERAAAGAGFAPRLVAEVGEDALALTLVAAGHGVALVPASAAPSPAEGVRFLTVLDGGLRRTVVAAVRRSRAADPAVRRLLDALAAAARRVAAAVPGVTAAIAPAPAAAADQGRRPDPLFDPLPPESPRSNGRRDPWADRGRPDHDLPARNGTNGAGLPPHNGAPSFGPPATDLPGAPSLGPAARTDLPAPGPALPGPAGDLSADGPDLPGRAGGGSPLGPARGHDLSGRPGAGGSDLPGRLAGDPSPLGPAAGPGASFDLPGRPPGGPDRAGDRPGGDAAGGQPFGAAGTGGPAFGAGPGSEPSAPPPPGDPGRNRSAPSYGSPAGGPARDADRPAPDLPQPPGPGRRAADPSGAGDLAGLSGLSGFSTRPGRDTDSPARDLPGSDLPSRGSDRGRDLPGPGSNLPGRGSDLPARPGFGAAAGGALPPPGALPAPGAGDPVGGLPAPRTEAPLRGGASPYRTPPSTGDAPDFTPDLGSGPNPYRTDTSAHPAPDPFRTTGTEPGPNPYRGNGHGRRESLGGSELFAAGQRPGTPPPAGDAAFTGRRSRAQARGGDGAEGTLPPAPPGAADDVRLSIFEDLQSEWFVQREDGAAAPSWQMAADDGWAAAARLAEPTTAGTTTAGLPRRRPQAMVVPGAVGGPSTPGAEVPPQQGHTHRSPQEVRGRLSSYRDGVRRGRHAEQPPDEQ